MREAHRSGSAHRGLGEWLWQRLTAVYLGAFLIYVLLRWWQYPLNDYNAWQTWMAAPTMRIGLSLFFIAGLAHAWIGLRSVYMDYLQSLGLRFTVSALTGVALIGIGLWVGEVLLWGWRP